MGENAPLRIAVAGYGSAGSRHCEAIASLSDLTLSAVFDKPQSGQKHAGLSAAAVDDFGALLADATIHAIAICLPSHLHAKYGRLAAEAGKHVIMEKPLDPDPAAARELMRVCEANGVILAPISQYRFCDGLQVLRAALAAQLLGQIHLVRASVLWSRNDEYYSRSDWRGRRETEAGGVLINQAIHAVDIMQWLLGNPVNVSAKTGNSRSDVVETEDAAIVLLEFGDGIIASLEAATFVQPGFGQRFEFYGSKGTCIVQDNRLELWHQADGAAAPAPAVGNDSEGNDRLMLFRRQYRNIAAAIRGTEPLAVTPKEALQALLTTKAMYESASSNSSVIPSLA